MINMRVFPNIFIQGRSSLMPMEKDLFLLLDVKRTVDDEFINTINDYYKDTVKALKEDREHVKKLITISKKEIMGCIKYLISNQLIVERDPDFYIFTGRGYIFKKYILSKEYRKYCLEEAVRYGERKDPLFWKLADIDPMFT